MDADKNKDEKLDIPIYSHFLFVAAALLLFKPFALRFFCFISFAFDFVPLAVGADRPQWKIIRRQVDGEGGEFKDALVGSK